MPMVIRFGVFELDHENEELRKAGMLIKLRPQAFKLLALLATRAGKLVSRDEIRQGIWGSETSVDFEQGVNRCIKEIRAALSDDAETPRYIKTVQRRGYIFIAPVHGVRQPSETKQEIKEWQLTTHSHEASVTSAAISPDGRYLAYSDDAEVYVKLIETGETHALRALQRCRVAGLSWFPDSTKLLASGEDWQGNVSGLWAVSIFGGVLWTVTHNAGDVAAVLEGSHVAFIGGHGKEVWLMRAGGEDPHPVFVGEEGDKLGLVPISDGPKLFFSKLRVGAYQFEVGIECLDLASGQVTTVLSDPRLRGSSVSPDGRLIYALAETASRQSDVNLWEIRFDVQTGQVAGQPRRLTNWIGSNLYGLSTTRGGDRLAFLKGPYQANVFVGELEEEGRALKNPRRLTLDDRNNLPTAWMPDSKAVLFHSDRNGKWEIFKQDLDERTAELLITDAQDCRAARISADGAWIIYFARNRDRMWSWSEPLTLMRAPVERTPALQRPLRAATGNPAGSRRTEAKPLRFLYVRSAAGEGSGTRKDLGGSPAGSKPLGSLPGCFEDRAFSRRRGGQHSNPVVG